MNDINEKNLYCNDARFYDLDDRPVTRIDIPFYLDHASSIAGDILELACGTGRVTLPLAHAGHRIWALEYSTPMVDCFREKLKALPREVSHRIHLFQGDMSRFFLKKTFPLILLPCRAFQLLLDEELENTCLREIHGHLTSEGMFIIDIGRFIPDRENVDAWLSEESVLDWENVDPKTGCHIQRTHINKEIDKARQIIFPRKTYRITRPDGTQETIVKRSPWRYFFEDQIKHLLVSNGFKIIREMGTYDGKSTIHQGTEFIFICRKA
ncbi:MAG: class I SAM-dependent methyltransferase [Candidatus Omnitrophota bacterium]